MVVHPRMCVCTSSQEGCCVLVRVRSRHSSHWESHGLPCDIHIPGTILKAPTHPQLSSAFYTVLAYNKKPVSATAHHKPVPLDGAIPPSPFLPSPILTTLLLSSPLLSCPHHPTPLLP